MTKKHWVWITIAIALLHALITGILTPISGDILFSRFDGNPYGSSGEPVLVGLYFILYLPFILVSFLLPPFRLFPAARYLLWIANSAAWGLLGAWLISKLPFMQDQDQKD